MFWKLLFLCLLVRGTECAYLLVEPSFLLVEEDWPIGTHLPVTLCPKNVRIISGDPSNYFQVVKINDTCATLQLNLALDADKENADGQKGQSFSLVVAGPKKSRATLEIQVVDVNDNAPVFVATPSSFELSESAEIGSEVFGISTQDPDTGVSGISRFSIEGDEFFTLDKRKCNNGKCSTTLRVARPLDFESKPIHTFNITAKDGDPHSNRTHTVTHTVTIHLKNENDEAPKFITDFSKPILISPKAKPDDVVLKLEAEDVEKTGISYSVMENEHFKIGNGANLVLKKLPQVGEIVTVEITAKQNGENGKSVKAEGKFQLADGKVNVEENMIKEKPSTSENENQKASENQLCEFPIYEARLIQGTGQFDLPVIIKTLAPTTDKIRLIGGSDIFDLIPREEYKMELTVKDVEKVAAQNLDNAQLLIKSPAGQCRITLKSISTSKNAPIPSKSKLSPNFEHPLYEFNVLENREPTVIGKVMVESSGPVSYELLGEHAEKFQISQSGEIQNRERVDREEMAKFELVVKATDQNGASTKSQVVINVKDENDNSPIFEKEHYLINIDEGKSEKVRITATDLDEGKNAQITYSILEKGNLPIDIADGVLFIGAIDREALPANEVNLTVTASDAGEPPRSSSVVVTIRVKDINDNPPIFSNSRYSIVLDANISPGGIVGKLASTDQDATSPNNYVHYSSQNQKFKVTDSGDIIFIGPGTLLKNEPLEFNVTATDGGEPANSAVAQIVLNEHLLSNSVQNELTTQINSNDTEKKAEIKWLNAGMPGYSYEIIRATSSGFEDSEVMTWIEIDKKSGRIVTLKRIDPDRVKTIKLYISMRKGKREVPVELIINVMDTDDVVPVYSRPTVTRKFTTSESATVGTTIGEAPVEGVKERDGVKPIFKNSSVFTVSLNEDSVLGTVLDLPYPLATDLDSGKFAQLRYSMTGDEGFFKIDEGNSTIRLVAPLDFETQRVHSLSIKCIDNNGEPPYHEVFASVTVNVLDVNDNDPVIHNTDLTHLNIGEDAVEGTVVTVLVISDADDLGKPRIDVNSTMFRVDDTYKLLVATPLKGYAGQRLCSTLTASDGAHTTSSPYCVTVYPAKNTHHNPLVISPKQNSIHYFDENIVYEELLKVKVLEEEGERGNVTFKLDEMFKKDWQMFSIGRVNGSLRARQPFDFEKKTVHEIKILACRVDNCTSTHLFISVNDRNDNCPMFPKQDVRLTVLENEKGKRQVGRIPAALDSDFHSDNTKVCYTTDTPIFFFSDPTLPILYTNSSFDREQKKQHQITITAYDCHLSCRDPHKPINGTIVALIDVIDVNDNFPKFTEKIYTTTVVQGQVTAGSHILTVQATDLDEELDGLKYSIRGFVRSPSSSFAPGEAPISVERASGEVTANELLKESSYSFTVVVVDGAGHEDTTSVMISVVTYAQQTELVFDAPFELIMKNEKKIADNLSNATGLQTIVDKCRQNSNFTLMLVHFTDRDGQFVNVDRAVNLLMTSPADSRRELRSVYGLREAFPPVPIPSRLPQYISIAVLLFFAVFILCLCIWCRQRNNYERKLRHISAQASTVHTVTLGRNQKGNPAYGEIPIATRHHPPPAPPPPTSVNLQSTEL